MRAELQPGLGLGLGFQSVFDVVVFRPRFPSDLSLKRARSSASATATAPRFTDVNSPDPAEGIATSFSSRGAGSSTFSATAGDSRTSLTSRACLCALAHVRDPQDHAPVAHQFLPDTRLREALWVFPMNGQPSHRTFSSLTS